MRSKKYPVWKHAVTTTPSKEIKLLGQDTTESDVFKLLVMLSRIFAVLTGNCNVECRTCLFNESVELLEASRFGAFSSKEIGSDGLNAFISSGVVDGGRSSGWRSWLCCSGSWGSSCSEIVSCSLGLGLSCDLGGTLLLLGLDQRSGGDSSRGVGLRHVDWIVDVFLGNSFGILRSH